MIDYRLIVITHGDCAPLRATLESFVEHVTPKPTSVWLHRDGPTKDGVDIPVVTRDGTPGETDFSHPAVGFCRSVAKGWAAAAAAAEPYVFWLEHDFRFIRDVDLNLLAAALDLNPEIAQMSFMRAAANTAELAAGGVVANQRARGSEFIERTLWATSAWFHRDGPGDTALPWLDHDAYFTTNPSLMTTAFMAENPWPTEYTSWCEGRFGIDLKARGHRFGIVGQAEPWVEHVGTRDEGFGY
jgi:hypothetical protein